MQLGAVFLREQCGDNHTALRDHARLQVRQSQVVGVFVMRRIDLSGLFQVGDSGFQIVLLNVKLAERVISQEAGRL